MRRIYELIQILEIQNKSITTIQFWNQKYEFIFISVEDYKQIIVIE